MNALIKSWWIACCFAFLAASLSAAVGTKVETAKPILEGFSLVWLADPVTAGIEFKDEWKFLTQKRGAEAVGSLIFDTDLLAGYRYHPKLHANAAAGYELDNMAYEVSMPASGEFKNEKRFYPYKVRINAAVESAPVEPASGDSLDWRASNTNATGTFTFGVPYTDILPEWIGRHTGSNQAANALFIDANAAYLDQREETARKKNGFRGMIEGGYAFPLFLDCELFGNYRYTWGKAAGSSKHFYAVQLSRYFRSGRLTELFTSITGKKEEPRIFVRYYEGGVAPAYTRSHGWEFGIGTSTF